MAEPSLDALHLEPYKNFRFRVRWDGRHVAGVSRVGALRRGTEVIKHREGGDATTGRKSPGQTEYEAITLERGVTQDTAFEDWANLTPGAGAASVNFRKDVVIEVYDESGQLALAYLVRRCWVSEYQALPDLDAGGNAVAFEQIKLENEGWERDRSVVPPGLAAPGR